VRCGTDEQLRTFGCPAGRDEDSMDQLIKRLRQEGCDVNSALTICMDMEDFYVKMLKMLAGDKQMERLCLAVKNRDPREVFEASHALKGMFANLGLTPLTEQNTLLVEESRHGGLADVDKNYAALREKYDYFMDLVRTLS